MQVVFVTVGLPFPYIILMYCKKIYFKNFLIFKIGFIQMKTRKKVRRKMRWIKNSTPLLVMSSDYIKLR